MSGRNKVTGAVAIAASASLALAACGGAAGGPQSDGGQADQRQGRHRPAQRPVRRLQGPVRAQLQGRDRDGHRDYKAKYGDDAVAKTIEVVQTDHQNKPDIANTKAQEMYDRQNADIILDVPTSSAALAVAGQAKAKKKLTSTSVPPRPALTGES